MEWRDEMFEAIQEYARVNALLASYNCTGVGNGRGLHRRVNDAWQKVSILVYQKHENAKPYGGYGPFSSSRGQND